MPHDSAVQRRLALLAALVAAIGACSDSPEIDFDAMVRDGTSLYARGKEEPIVRSFFRDQRNGFFVDVGCWRPVENNTTYFLEKHLGWSGIAIDGIERLGRQWRKERPQSRFFHYAVTDRSGETLTFHESLSLSSTDGKAIEFWEGVKGEKLGVNLVEVPTITLTDLLDREGVTQIDFLKIDINGTEPTALAGFDIQRFRPALVHVEAHERNHRILLDYFERNGYRRLDEYLKYDRSNWYFAPKESS